MDHKLQSIAQLVQEHRYAEARSALQEHLSEHPDSAHAWYMLSYAADTAAVKLDAAEQAAQLAPDEARFAARAEELRGRSEVSRRSLGALPVLPRWLVPIVGLMAAAVLILIGFLVWKTITQPAVEEAALAAPLATNTLVPIPTDLAAAPDNDLTALPVDVMETQVPAPSSETAPAESTSATDQRAPTSSPTDRSAVTSTVFPTPTLTTTPSPAYEGPDRTVPTVSGNDEQPTQGVAPTHQGPPPTLQVTLTPFPTPTAPPPPPGVSDATAIGVGRLISGVGTLRVVSAERPGDGLFPQLGGSVRKAPSGYQWLIVELLLMCGSQQACPSTLNGFEVLGSSGTAYSPDSGFNVELLFNKYGSIMGQVWGYLGFLVPTSEADVWLRLTYGGTDYIFALE